MIIKYKYDLLRLKQIVTSYQGPKINIPKIFQISRSTYYHWKKYSPKQRKVKITPNIKCFIRTYVINKINFDYKKLINIIQRKFYIQISKSSVYNILKQMKITKKKIQKKLNPLKKIKTNQLLKEFKQQIKNTDQNDIIAIDETSIDTHISSDFGWAPYGHRIHKIYKNRRIRYTLICAVSNRQIIHYKMIKNSANKNTFLDFIKTTIQKFKKNKSIKLLMDNARIHHAKILKKYLSTIESVNIIYNIPYMPKYNPIENVFNEFKMNIKKYKITNKNIFKKVDLALKKVKLKNLSKYFKTSLSI